MAELQLEDISYRQSIIAEIKSSENDDRMAISQKACDVYDGNIKSYIEDHLNSRFSDNTVSQMAIVSSINVTKKVVDIKGSIYKEAPERVFSDVSDSQNEALNSAYIDMSFNAKMLRSNRLYELQNHNHVMILPKKGKLSARCLKDHQLNVVPSDIDQEVGEIYILSSFDKSAVHESNGINEEIADQDDWMTESERYIVWSPSYHFVMNGKGVILTEDILNPIAPIIPIVEVSDDKDFEYWMNQNESLSTFTIEYNALLSSLGFQVDLQGHAQAVLSGPAQSMPNPSQITVGISKILILPIEQIDGIETKFEYVSPNGDLAGSQLYAESILSMFLSSQGIDPKAISGSSDSSASYSSGVERLLAMIEKFESSKDTQHIYQSVEENLFKVVTAWMNLGNASLLDAKYHTQQFNESARVNVKFKRPDAEISDTEKLAVIEKELELELITKTEAIAKYRVLDDKAAEDKMKEIEETLTPINDDMPPSDTVPFDDNQDNFGE